MMGIGTDNRQKFVTALLYTTKFATQDKCVKPAAAAAAAATTSTVLCIATDPELSPSFKMRINQHYSTRGSVNTNHKNITDIFFFVLFSIASSYRQYSRSN